MTRIIFIFKTLIAAILISFVSWVAGKKPVLAGFIIALPLTSILAILFSYAQYRDMEKINQFASSILIVVPLSLTFFIPFLLNRWFKMNFAITFLSAITCLAIAYIIGSSLLKIDLSK